MTIVSTAIFLWQFCSNMKNNIFGAKFPLLPGVDGDVFVCAEISIRNNRYSTTTLTHHGKIFQLFQAFFEKKIGQNFKFSFVARTRAFKIPRYFT